MGKQIGEDMDVQFRIDDTDYTCNDWFNIQRRQANRGIDGVAGNLNNFNHYKETGPVSDRGAIPFPPSYPSYYKANRCPGHADRIFYATFMLKDNSVIEVDDADVLDYNRFEYSQNDTGWQSDHYPVYSLAAFSRYRTWI